MVDGHRQTALSRRAFLAGSLAFGLAGCAEDDTSSATAGTSTTTTRPGQGAERTLVALFDARGGIIEVGRPQRLTWAVGDRNGVLISNQPSHLDLRFDRQGEDLGTVRVRRRGTGLDQDYLTASTVFGNPGVTEVSTVIDGIDVVAELRVVARGESGVPGRGDRLPRVRTPTFAAPMGAAPLCSREPACPFHRRTLLEELDRARPMALLIASPGYCESTLCPAGLDLLIDAARDFPGITYIHAEVYADADRATSLLAAERTELVRELGLRFEPSLFVVSSTGVVLDRLDNIFDVTELHEVLASVG